jgi:hypothetical protein
LIAVERPFAEPTVIVYGVLTMRPETVPVEPFVTVTGEFPAFAPLLVITKRVSVPVLSLASRVQVTVIEVAVTPVTETPVEALPVEGVVEDEQLEKISPPMARSARVDKTLVSLVIDFEKYVRGISMKS